MSTLNLVPWRERQRWVALRRWQVGVVCGAIVTTLTLLAIDHALNNINQAHEARLAALQSQPMPVLNMQATVSGRAGLGQSQTIGKHHQAQTAAGGRWKESGHQSSCGFKRTGCKSGFKPLG